MKEPISLTAMKKMLLKLLTKMTYLISDWIYLEILNEFLCFISQNLKIFYHLTFLIFS